MTASFPPATMGLCALASFQLNCTFSLSSSSPAFHHGVYLRAACMDVQMGLTCAWRVSAAAATSGKVHVVHDGSNPFILAGDVALLSCRAAGKAKAPRLEDAAAPLVEDLQSYHLNDA